MKVLQWFPGHMTAAMRMMEDNLKAVDGVIMVLDARAPNASVNNKLGSLFKDKKVLYVLNKCDLVESADVKRKILEFTAQQKQVVAISAMNKKSVDALYNKMFEMLTDKIERNKRKGVFINILI